MRECSHARRRIVSSSCTTSKYADRKRWRDAVSTSLLYGDAELLGGTVAIQKRSREAAKLSSASLPIARIDSTASGRPDAVESIRAIGKDALLSFAASLLRF